MYSSYESPPSWKEPLSKERVIPQNPGIPLEPVFHKSKLFHKTAVFCKTRYSVKSSYSDITHFLYSSCIPQSPVSQVFIVFKMMASSNSTSLLVDSNFNTIIEINNRNQHHKLPLPTKLKLQTLLHHQDISDFTFSLSSK